MPVLYVDYEGGDDNYAGTSFALLASGTNGRIATTTFSAATASFPNDGSLINQYLSIFNGSIYAVYRITAWLSSTSLTIAAISGGTALADRAVDSQYYIGGRWKTFVNGATGVRIGAGDTIRAMASPDPTSLGIGGTWTSGPLQATTSITGATNATPIAITVTAHGYATGDTVVITGVGGNTNANGTWEITVTGANTFTLNGSVGSGAYTSGGTARRRNNTRVSLASSLTQNIECCGEFTNWTGVTNVTPTLNTSSFKEHRASQQIAVGAAFSTGLACYKTLPATLDLSGYQQVSFWIAQTAGTATTATSINLRLCSDSVGVTTVNTISIPALTLNIFTPIVFDNGAPLGSNINSIAFNVNTDAGAQTFLLDNIIACKASSSADSLTLASLIGKNTTGEGWWPIQSINGTRVMLDHPGQAPNSATTRGYLSSAGIGTTTVTTFKRECINTHNHGLGATFMTINEGGSSSSNLLTYSGGWNRTDMSTKTGESWFHGRYTQSTFSSPVTNMNFFRVEDFGAAAYSGNAFNQDVNPFTMNNFEYERCYATSCNIGFRLNRFTTSFVNNVYTNSSNTGASYGTGLNETASAMIVGFAHTNMTFESCTTAFSLDGSPVSGWPRDCRLTNLIARNCATGIFAARAIRWTFNNNTLTQCDTPMGFVDSTYPVGLGHVFNNLNCDTTISINTTVDPPVFNNSTIFRLAGSRWSGYPSSPNSGYWISNVYINNTTITDSTEVADINTHTNGRLYSHNHDNTIDNHKIFTDGGLISAATDQRKTPSGISWKLQPTSTNRSSTYPLVLSLAKIAVSASSLVTVKGWMRRDNTGLTMRLVCKGGQIAGVSTDVVASMTAAANTWEELTINFTPTQKGVVEITAEAFGGSTLSGWVDDLTITQV